MLYVNDEVEVAAEMLDESGLGVAHAEHFVIHAADLLPGEHARVRIDHVSPHRSAAWARVVERTSDPSIERVAPDCPGAGQCGGCVWQHTSYLSQLRHKGDRIASAVGHCPAVTPAPQQLGYRNTAKYVVNAHKQLGSYAERSHQWISTQGCAVVAPAIAACAEQIEQLLQQSSLRPYDEASGSGDLRYIVIRQTSLGQVLVGLVTTSACELQPLRMLAHDITADSVLRVDNDAKSAVILGPTAVALRGPPRQPHRIVGVDVAVGVHEFLQVNSTVADALYTCVADQLATRGVSRVLDLYCGIGGFSWAAAARGICMHGIERTPQSVAAASAAATSWATHAPTFAVGDAETIALGIYDAVIVNPPRRGLGQALVNRLASQGPALVAYVSCNPASLARDLEALRAAGYQVEIAGAYDLMPGTPQVETVAILTR